MLRCIDLGRVPLGFNLLEDVSEIKMGRFESFFKKTNIYQHGFTVDLDLFVLMGFQGRIVAALLVTVICVFLKVLVNVQHLQEFTRDGSRKVIS